MIKETRTLSVSLWRPSELTYQNTLWWHTQCNVWSDVYSVWNWILFFSPSWVRLELKHKETTALDSAKMKTYVLFLFLFSASLQKHSCLIVATLTFSVKLKNPFYGPSEHYKSYGDMGSICLHFVVCLLNVYLRFFKKFCDCCSLMQKWFILSITPFAVVLRMLCWSVTRCLRLLLTKFR